MIKIRITITVIIIAQLELQIFFPFLASSILLFFLLSSSPLLYLPFFFQFYLPSSNFGVAVTLHTCILDYVLGFT
jgi:hypothetical protein